MPVLESKNIRVHLVCEEDLDAWILGKFALRLREGLLARGIQCDLSNKPDRTVDINHYINFLAYHGRQTTIETVMVTHIDTEKKVRMLYDQLAQAEFGICMSSETVENLAAHGIPRGKLCFIHPGHDGILRPRKTIVGITSRIYPDARKRENVLVDLAASISPEDFAFRIMGAGWDAVVAQLRLGGFEVDYFTQFDTERYYALIPTLDYYLYLGLDEGSMGYLDALSAGVATIVTAQGFHLDVPNGITYPFIEGEQLKNIFSAIATEKKRRQLAVANWTWPSYVDKHLTLWEYILARKTGHAVRESFCGPLREIGVVFNEAEPDLSAVNFGTPTIASVLKKEEVCSRFQLSPPLTQLRLRVGTAEDIEFMNYLMGVGDKGMALRIAWRVLRASPVDLSVWRRVVSAVLKSNRLLRQLHAVYKSLWFHA